MNNRGWGGDFKEWFGKNSNKRYYNEDKIDYFINIPNYVDVPIYKEIKSYKNKSQLNNYKYHVSLAEGLKENIKFYNKMINREVNENFLIEYLDYDFFHHLGESEFPDWYYYKNDNIHKVTKYLKEQLTNKIIETYGYKIIDIYCDDNRLFHQEKYIYPAEVNWIFTDCYDTYVLVDGKKINKFDYKDDKEIYLKAMRQENVNFTPSLWDENEFAKINTILCTFIERIEDMDIKFYSEENKLKVDELIKYLYNFINK